MKERKRNRCSDRADRPVHCRLTIYSLNFCFAPAQSGLRKRQQSAFAVGFHHQSVLTSLFLSFFGLCQPLSHWSAVPLINCWRCVEYFCLTKLTPQAVIVTLQLGWALQRLYVLEITDCITCLCQPMCILVYNSSLLYFICWRQPIRLVRVSLFLCARFACYGGGSTL